MYYVVGITPKGAWFALSGHETESEANEAMAEKIERQSKGKLSADWTFDVCEGRSIRDDLNDEIKY